MKTFLLALSLPCLLWTTSSFAFPAGDQTILAQSSLTDAHDALSAGKQDLDRFYHDGRDFMKQNGLTYELVSHPSFSQHQLRITEPEICDPSVQQYSGYLDIDTDKHLFFWFFEARNSPETAPLLLWLNGGPGCSSSIGLLFELGPCSIADEGRNTTYNPYGWNTNANIIFLDQPVNVGFSFADNGTSVSDSQVASKDVWVFLEMFLARFPKYSDLPFHIAAESYGGVYAPNIATVINTQNKAMALAPTSNLKRINLASVILANGLTNPYVQFGSIPEYLCNGPYPVYDDPFGADCITMKAKTLVCQALIKACYLSNSKLACAPANDYCFKIFDAFNESGRNQYDVRKPCPGGSCYEQRGWIDVWMNSPGNKAALGVDPKHSFESCNDEVGDAFIRQGDGMHNTALLLPELINDGIRLLVYAGDADMSSNIFGEERLVEQLETKFFEEFKSAKSRPWVTTESGKVAGEVRSAGGSGFTAGNVTFVNVYEAGHLVPFDQPEAALDLITRWIRDVPLA